MHAVPQRKVSAPPASSTERDRLEREVAISSRGCTRGARFQLPRGAADSAVAAGTMPAPSRCGVLRTLRSAQRPEVPLGAVRLRPGPPLLLPLRAAGSERLPLGVDFD